MQTNDWYKIELLVLDKDTWNHLTVCKQKNTNNSFENKVTYKLLAYKSYIETRFGIK